MTATTWISLAAFVLAVLSLVFSRRDAQSKKTREELQDLRDQVSAHEEKIQELGDEILRLEAENRTLRDENVWLMKKFVSCPAPNCPLVAPHDHTMYTGPERRKKPR